MSDKISREDAQAEINGLLVAEICRDFGINFLDVYPRHILERGVGPEQAFIGLAIKRGHLALPAVQPDAAAIREAALVKALDAAFPIVRKASVAAKMDAVNASPSDPTALRREAWIRECDAALELVVSALALIDNPRKEVVPSEPNGSAKGPRDIGPGDQAVAGAADYAALRQDIRNMVDLCEIYGEEETLAVDLESALGALSYLDAYECWNWPPPRILVEGNSIVLTWEIGNWKLYQYCDDEMQKIFRWTGTPVAGAAGPTEGGE